MKSGRWVQNIGGIAQWIPSAVLLLVGLVALTRFGSATPMPATSLVPNFAALPTILFFANLCFGFAGLELAPVMAGEVVEPRRTFPRAIIISGLTIAACYLLGTISLLWSLPPSETSIISGVNQAVTKAGARIGLPWLGPPTALLMTLAGLGGVGAWLIGSARILFVGGLDKYLPPIFGATHPKWKTPWFALLFQAALSAVFILAATQGDTVKNAYLKLVNATLIVYFLPYLYMFAAAIKMRLDIARQPGAVPIPGRRGRQLVLEQRRLRDDARRDRPRAHPAGRLGRPRRLLSPGCRRLVRLRGRRVRSLRARRAPPPPRGVRDLRLTGR